MTDQFDERLELWGRHVPEDFKQALIDVNDTLDMCVTMAKTRFGEMDWTPADAIALLRLTMEQERHLRARREAEEREESED
jgi:hypothetical protein